MTLTDGELVDKLEKQAGSGTGRADSFHRERLILLLPAAW